MTCHLEKEVNTRKHCAYSPSPCVHPDIIAIIANLVSTLISVDRCVHIALPLQVQSLVSRRGFWVIFGVASLALACSGQIIVFSYDTACAYYSDSQVEPTWLVIPSTFYLDNKAFLDILDTVVMNSVVPILSLAVTAVTTTITVVKLNHAMKWRNRCSSSSKLSREEIGLTRMLVVISGIYIACVSPRVLTSLTRLLVPDYRPWTRLCNLVVVMETFVNALVAINSVINFFVYISLGSKFKQTLRSLVFVVTKCNWKTAIEMRIMNAYYYGQQRDNPHVASER
ncbi:hypothetical protein C0Q70_19724 [Pomacea canaliculata]|uniref:G-protein coupled receptors family 1 profile domain-containing protein n=1 Tax=Pomacea canaliculata TaxID=400727 RepID=A0A2T7NDI6_POMCA|nr:hypothetical protein C0Q70_19724 [Pomacea canaliculata]